MAANKLLQRAVERAHRRLGRPRREQRFRNEAIAAPTGQTLGATEQCRSPGLLGDSPDERHRVGGFAEELDPFAFTDAGHLVGQYADRLAASECLQHRAHAPQIGGNPFPRPPPPPAPPPPPPHGPPPARVLPLPQHHPPPPPLPPPLPPP